MITTQPHVDLTAVKRRQQATWSSGDYAVIGTTLAITGERLCEAVDLRAGQRVLDVAAGLARGSAWPSRPLAYLIDSTIQNTSGDCYAHES